jgi:hypothetical protein
MDIPLFSAEASVCPVISLEQYVEFRNKTSERNNDKEPFFVKENGKALARNYFIHSLKMILAPLGYNSDLYDGHICNIGITIYGDYYSPTLTKCTTITVTPEFCYVPNTVLVLNH